MRQVGGHSELGLAPPVTDTNYSHAKLIVIIRLRQQKRIESGAYSLHLLNIQQTLQIQYRK